MSTPPKCKFPREFEGGMRSSVEIAKLSGVSRYDQHKAFQADATITTVGALKAAVRALKSYPLPVHRPPPSSQFQINNSMPFPRRKTQTAKG